MNAQPNRQQFALSPLHVAVSRLQRMFDATVINEIVNHPDVLPHVGGSGQPLDLSDVVKDPQNICFYDDGCVGIFNALTPGIFEIHSMALPEKRGKQLALAAAAAMHVIFTRTRAIEVITRIPPGNIRAFAAAKRLGFRLEFTTPHGWISPTGSGPVGWYRLSLQDWASIAPGLVERGRWFHDKVEAACARSGVVRAHHPDDDTHNRFAGMACEMILGGMIEKGLHFLNRFNAITRAPAVQVMSVNPLVIHIGDIALGVNLETQEIDIVKAQ